SQEPKAVQVFRSEDAACKKRNSPAGEAQEAAWPGERVLRQQEQAVSRSQRVGRYRAEVCVCRPPPQETRFPPSLGRAHQRGRARERSHVRAADKRTEERRSHARPQKPLRARRLESGRLCAPRRTGEGRS